MTKFWGVVLLVSVLLGLISRVQSAEAAAIGIDGSNPPSRTSWRIARVYNVLTVKRGKDVAFSWAGAQGIKLAVDQAEYDNCTGNGTVLVPDYSPAGTYIFATAAAPVGRYYFYNPQKDGLYCKTNMRAIVDVVDSTPVSCGSAKSAGACKKLSKCQWRRMGRRRLCLSSRRNRQG